MRKAGWPPLGNAAGDPYTVAQIVLRLAAGDDPPAHLLLGSDDLHYFGEAAATRSRAAAWRAASRSTDIASSGPILECSWQNADQ
jgi:hypothetical protein